MERLNAIMKAVCDRPGMYVVPSDMRMVRAFLDGYVMALSAELGGYPFGGFLRWLEVQNDICHPGWGWDRILVHAAGSHEAAIRSLPQQFAQYCDEVARGTFDVDTARQRHFRGSSRQPQKTCTDGWHDH